MEENLISNSTLKNNTEKSEKAEHYSPLVLAYIGDSIFEVFVRQMLVERANMQVNKLHKAASSIVKAESQSRMIDYIMPLLTEKEVRVYRRGRNAKSHTSAKNASVTDYRRATGFEALIGYLYLNDEHERMVELMKKAVEEEEKDRGTDEQRQVK